MTSTSTIDSTVNDAASEFLRHSVEGRHKSEGNVQSDLEALLRTIGVGSLESHYSTSDGEADIFLPNLRTFIEVKAFPLAADPEKPQQRTSSETPREQLDRYVVGEINREYGRIPTDDEEHNRRNWQGILTDGRHWHVYEYPHRPQSEGLRVNYLVFLNEGKNLASFLLSTLQNRKFGKEWIPSNPGSLFTSLRDELIKLYRDLPGRASMTTRTKKELWLDMMQTSGMVPKDDAGKDRLFVIHSFLIAVVRFVSFTLFPTGSGSDWKRPLKDGFASWVLDFRRGEKWAREVHALVETYDWRRREEDVLRSLYHENVSDQDRKMFGEFYTPDWLAELMVSEVLDNVWLEQAVDKAANAMYSNSNVSKVGVLDPTCGSGTFLYHAARRILSCDAISNFSDVEKSDIVTRLVNGMDIHPVAVELARVNLERVLPSQPKQGRQALQIYLGDSLQTDTSAQSTLFDHTDEAMRISTPGKREYSVPMSLVRRSTFPNDMGHLVNAAVEGKPIPEYITQGFDVNDLELLKKCHTSISEIIASEGNSVWTWYTINLAAPHLMSLRKVDRIVANPPWVKLAEIQVKSRKVTMEQYGTYLGVLASGKHAPHTDIASYFILAARRLYMSNPESNPACWLVKKSAIGSGQWAPFRQAHKETLQQSVDLEQLQPFGSGDARRSCLLTEHMKLSGQHKEEKKLEAYLKSKGDRPRATESFASAYRKFTFDRPSESLPKAPSEYFNTVQIRQGATLVPHVLVLLDKSDGPDQNDQIQITTRRSTKGKWKELEPQVGMVPRSWIYPVMTSKEMATFVPSVRTNRTIIPVGSHGYLLDNPEGICRFWGELDEIYGIHKGIGGGTPKTLLKRLDYQKSLSRQLEMEKDTWLVLYPSSGDIMRAARTQAGQHVVDSNLYWLPARNMEEAGYLVALLNATCLKRAFAESKDSGRDFHLHPWRKIPIPRFDGNNRKHLRLAELCSKAEVIAKEITDEQLSKTPEIKQVALSKHIRGILNSSDISPEIETIIADLLPEQATSE